MTREEAIKILEEHPCSTGEVDGNTCAVIFDAGLDDTEEALDMAISALREQEERSKGCEFCCYTEYPDKKLYPKENDGFDFYAGAWKRLADDDFIEDETDHIKFCNMCGRRLEEV